MNKQITAVLIIALIVFCFVLYGENREIKENRNNEEKKVNYTHSEIQEKLKMCFAPRYTAEVMQRQGYSEQYSETVEENVIENLDGGE